MSGTRTYALSTQERCMICTHPASEHVFGGKVAGEGCTHGLAYPGAKLCVCSGFQATEVAK